MILLYYYVYYHSDGKKKRIAVTFSVCVCVCVCVCVFQIPFSLAVEMWENMRHKGFSCFDEFNPHSEHLQVRPLVFKVCKGTAKLIIPWPTGE